jgi:hypothetical protein
VLALAMVQSLRDVNTSVNHDIVVLLPRGGVGSPECHDQKWKKAMGREDIPCSGPSAIAEEIISPAYIASLQRLGAKMRVVDPVPRTKWTNGIPGGTQSFWGMSLNRCAAAGGMGRPCAAVPSRVRQQSATTTSPRIYLDRCLQDGDLEHDGLQEGGVAGRGHGHAQEHRPPVPLAHVYLRHHREFLVVDEEAPGRVEQCGHTAVLIATGPRAPSVSP